MSKRNEPFHRGVYPRWTPEDDARLMSICSERPIKASAGWEKVREDFPERTAIALRQRYLELRKKAGGIVRKRVRPSEAKPQLRAAVQREPLREPAPPIPYKTLTAAVFGDPRPGQSALDKMRSGGEAR